MEWPYKEIDQSDFEKSIQYVETLIVEYGGIYITNIEEKEVWYSNSGMEIKELVNKNIYRFRKEYIRLDRMYYPDKPSIVLEFSDCIEGPYEDADPFPYDLSSDDIECEIKYAMLIEPYPDWQERAKREKWMPKAGNLMIWRNRYAIYNDWEDAYLVDVESKERISIGSYYGDPEMALLDTDEKIAVVASGNSIGVYDVEKQEFKSIETSIPEWIKSIDITERSIRIICEEQKIYEFAI